MESEQVSSSETLNHNNHLHDDHDEQDNHGLEDNDTDSIIQQPDDSPINQSELLKAVAVVERDSVAIADSFSSLFSSLRLALSEVTSRSVDHVQCFSDAAGRLQESALDSATKGNLYINSCLRLNEEMRGIETLAMQLKVLRRNVDALDSAVSSLVRLP